MKLVIYPLLSTQSRRAMVREYKKFGHTYNYRPRGHLIKRLCEKLAISPDKVLDQIQKERDYIIKSRVKE